MQILYLFIYARALFLLLRAIRLPAMYVFFPRNSIPLSLRLFPRDLIPPAARCIYGSSNAGDTTIPLYWLTIESCRMKKVVRIVLLNRYICMAEISRISKFVSKRRSKRALATLSSTARPITRSAMPIGTY